VVQTYETAIAEAVHHARREGDLAAWEPNDVAMPPWWPRRSRASRAERAQEDLRAAERVYLALTLLAVSFHLSDAQLAEQVRSVARAHLRDGTAVLTRGARQPWQRAEHVLPAWSAPDGGTIAPLPGPAAELLDTLSLLHAYDLAAHINDDAARVSATTAIARALHEQAHVVSGQLDRVALDSRGAADSRVANPGVLRGWAEASARRGMEGVERRLERLRQAGIVDESDRLTVSLPDDMKPDSKTDV
jgi:hypothetical protein